MSPFSLSRIPGASGSRCLRALLFPLMLLTPAALGGQVLAIDPPVRPGDVVRLTVWREEHLTGDFQVDQHGLVTLPLIGELNVNGETELSLRKRVREALHREIWNPSIDLFVLKRVRVLGAVERPGLYELNSTMSVADALAMAGGRTPAAREGQVTLRREDTTLVTDVRDSMQLAELNVRTGDELLVLQRGWLSRNGGAVVTGMAALIGLLVTVLR